MDVSKKPLLAVVADVHLGNFRDFGGKTYADGLNERGLLTMVTLKLAIARASLIGCPLAVAGDLFHHKRPEPAVIAAAQEVFDDERAIIIPGNHDTVDASAEGGNTACETLSFEALVCNVETTVHLRDGDAALFIPFDARMPMAKFIDEQLAARDHLYDNKGELALVTHVGVVDDDSAPWLRDSSDAIHKDKLFDLMDREGIVVAFVGNYHQHREWERNGKKIVQVGALNPTGFGDEGLEGYGGYAVWYGGTDVRWNSVPGPRFVRMRYGQPYPEVPDGCSVYIRADRIGVPFPAEGYAGVEEVEPDVPLEMQLNPARLVDDAETALEEYVDKMPMPEGVTKAEVMTKLRELWRKTT